MGGGMYDKERKAVDVMATKVNNVVVGIDPSVRHARAGWAVLRHRRPGSALVEAGTIDIPDERKLPWPIRAIVIAHEAIRIAEQASAGIIVCEMPAVFHSARGRQGTRTEAIQKLYYLVGCIAGKADELGIPFETYTPIQWKGNIPKEVTIRRINRKYGTSISDNNVADAVGIAAYHISQQ